MFPKLISIYFIKQFVHTATETTWQETVHIILSYSLFFPQIVSYTFSPDLKEREPFALSKYLCGHHLYVFHNIWILFDYIQEAPVYIFLRFAHILPHDKHDVKAIGVFSGINGRIADRYGKKRDDPIRNF